MKKNLLIAVLVIFTLTANTQSRWSVGVQSGLLTNVAKFSSGDENANALFSNELYKTAHLGVSFRYRLCDHLSLQSGLTFTEFGFTYSVARNYSLLKPEKRFSEMNTSTCMTGIPAMLIFNGKLSCTNTRVIAGAGFILRGIDGEWKSENQTEVTSTNARAS